MVKRIFRCLVNKVVSNFKMQVLTEWSFAPLSFSDDGEVGEGDGKEEFKKELEEVRNWEVRSDDLV